MLFRLQDIFKSYGAHEVLQGATFQINPRERVGLVGRNGAGKTTIFRLISGLEDPDRGQVLTLKGLRAGLLEQQPSFSGKLSVLEEALSVFTDLREIEVRISQLEHDMGEVSGDALEEVMNSYSDLRAQYEHAGGFLYRARTESVLAGLGFALGDLSRPADQLSGGQKARLALARLLLAQPDILLLDEPTNHLDVAAVEWLEDFLAEYSKAFVIVSHDRFLLDRTTTKVVEIDAGIANVYAGNYTAYVRQREERRAAQARQYRQQQQLVGRTEEFIRRNLAGQKTKQAKSRRNMLERLDRVEAVKTERIGSFGFRKIARTGDNVLAVSHLVIGYGRHPLTSEISVLVRRGDRLGIIGANASGKTSFLKTVMGKIEPISGGFTWGANVLPGYFDQDLSGLNPSSTVFEELSRIAPGATAGELRSYLAMFLFTGDEVSKQVSVLSGGEQSRLALARLIYGSANVLVLDEPTNHLDIPSREALEQALGEYPGTIIVVSHDRYFLDRIATEILHFEDHKVTHHRGSYSEYYAIRHHLEPARGDSPPRRKPEKPSRKRPEAAKKPRVRPAAAIEEEIHGLEQEMEELSNRLSNPEPGWGGDQYAEFAARREELSSRLEELYREWDLTEAPDAINSSPGKP